ILASADSGAVQLNAGHIVTIALQISEPVNITGAPQLQLNNHEIASYVGGSGTQSLTFTYKVRPGDDISDLQVTGLVLNGGSISDAAGNSLSGTTQGDLSLTIDTTPPRIIINAIDGGGFINGSEASTGITISGSASDPFGGVMVEGQTVTVSLNG